MGIRIGAQEQVNTGVAKDQQFPSVTGLADGGWVVTWQTDPDNDFNAWDIVQQRYTSAGVKAGDEVGVNVTLAGTQQHPSVAPLGAGWIVAWSGYSDSDTDGGVMLRRFGGDGLPIDPMGMPQDILANAHVAGEQGWPAVAGFSNGRWVVAWQSSGQEMGGGANSTGIFLRSFDAAGNPSAMSDSQVNTLVEDDQAIPRIAALPNEGDWVTVWESALSNGAADVRRQRFDGSEEIVSLDSQVGYEPDVVPLADGGWVVAFESDGLVQRRYDSNGTPAKETFVTTAGSPSDVDLAALPDGGWILAYKAYVGQHLDAYVQRFARDGSRIGAEFHVGAIGDQPYDRPLSVTSLADGGWTVAWNGFDMEGIGGDDTLGIFQRTFRPTAPVVSLAGTAAKEYAGAGTLVGTLPAAGPMDAVSYSLANDAGGRFSLSGDRLVVKNGLLLDYEQAKSHTVTVTATDAAGLTTSAALTVQVGNVSPEKTAGSSGRDTLFGGTGKDKIYGGAGNDILKGGSNLDVLRGDGHNDRLSGGAGKDTLTGGSGKDVFAFDTKPVSSGVDRVVDFNVRYDSLWFDNAAFTKLGKGTVQKPVKLKPDAFHKGARAEDAQDRVVYDPASGKLYYDQDGEGGRGQVLVAQLSKALKMTYADVFVI